MQLILSPAKTFKIVPEEQLSVYEALYFDKETRQLVDHVKNYTEEELCQWMKMSLTLGSVNRERYQNFYDTTPKAYEALALLDGEAYRGLEGETLEAASKAYLQEHLMILSGLYGCIQPLDKIQPYRLEMGSKMKAFETKDLYTFWKDKLTDLMLTRLGKDPHEKVLINLASTEYSKALDLKKIATHYPVLTIHFKEKVAEDTYKVVGMYAKKMRGKMARYCGAQGLQSIEDLRNYTEEGYVWSEALSTSCDWVYIREGGVR